MKRLHFYRWLWVAPAFLVPVMVQSAAGNGREGHEPHGSFAQRFDHHDRDHQFFHRRHFFFGFDFVAFGFPYWWYPNYGYYYPDYYSDEYVSYGSSPVYDERFWQDLAARVQSELARRGYYHGQINGVIDLDSRQAIRAFQRAQRLPVTGLVDPGVLKALKIPVPQIPSSSG